MEDNQTNPEQLSEHKIQSCEEGNIGSSSFSASFMSRNQDISFGAGSPTCDAQSPTFTCRSSFSSFLVEPVTPFLVSGGFSFKSVGDSTCLEFSSPVPSMLSFSFLSPTSVEQKSCKLECSANMSDVNAIAGEANLGKLLVLQDSPLCIGREVNETDRKPVDAKRASGMNGHRMLGIHSKRNRTIGLGECEQLDLVVTESVIRWSSCTQLPTSLRSSLVC